MKQLLVIAIALTSVNAFATRARMTALGNSPHLVDVQTVYAKPAAMFNLAGDYVTLESGATGGVTTPVTANENANAEGMIVRTMGDAKLGLSLGHQSKNASTWGLRNQANDDLKINQQNPIEFTYGAKAGEMAWAGTLVYSNYNNKSATAATVAKESSMGVRFGAAQGAWDGTVSLGLTNTVENAERKFTGTSAMGLTGGYQMDTMYFFGNFTTAGAKQETTAGLEEAKLTSQDINLGVVNSHKKDGNELFYSVALAQTEFKNATAADLKVTSMTLPITIGLEVAAADWLTLRGSVSQSTLINSTKTTTSTPTTSEQDPAANSTKVAMGAGLKFKQVMFDGTLSTATTQTVNTTDLLAQAGMSYWF